MNPVAEAFAQLTAVDGASRTIVHQLEIPVPHAAARDAMQRPPDFEGPHIVSWGRVRRDEAERLVAREQGPEARQELLGELAGIFASDGVVVTLFYAEPRHGE